jgi:hypothetical protein
VTTRWAILYSPLYVTVVLDEWMRVRDYVYGRSLVAMVKRANSFSTYV